MGRIFFSGGHCRCFIWYFDLYECLYMVRIHINRHVIASNQKTGDRKPPITVVRGKARQYGQSVTLLGNARIVYSPDKPLSCGARLWIEADDAEVVL